MASLLQKARSLQAPTKKSRWDFPQEEIYQLLDALLRGEINTEDVSRAVFNKRGHSSSFIISNLLHGFKEGRYKINSK